MPHSTLLDFEFTYTRMIPRVPIRFFHRNGTPQALSNEKFDCGSTHIVISRTKAEELDLQLSNTTVDSYTAAGAVSAFGSTINFNLGTADRHVEYTNIPIVVIDRADAQTLIGISPIWEDYIITLNAHEKIITMEPRS